MENKNVIPIFFAIDDGYIPFLAVSLQSLIENSKKENFYLIKIFVKSKKSIKHMILFV